MIHVLITVPINNCHHNFRQKVPDVSTAHRKNHLQIHAISNMFHFRQQENIQKKHDNQGKM